jgi:hypothetical protein
MVSELLSGVAAIVATIAVAFGTDGVLTSILNFFCHGFLADFVHWITSGIQNIIVGISGKIGASQKVWLDLTNLVGDIVAIIVGGFDVWNARKEIIDNGGKFLVKLGNFFQYGLNKKTLAAFF